MTKGRWKIQRTDKGTKEVNLGVYMGGDWLGNEVQVERWRKAQVRDIWWRGGEGKLNRINTESDWPTKQAQISLAHLQFCLEILIIIYLHSTNIDRLNNNAIILYLYSSKCMQNMTIQRFENRSINIHHYINGWFCTFSTRPTKINDWVKTVQIDTQCLPYLASLLP